jgi:single-stranded DNA-binding protein
VKRRNGASFALFSVGEWAIKPFCCAFLPFDEMFWSCMEIASAMRISFVKLLGQNFSLRYPEATTYIPCEITGKSAEQTASEVEAGDVLQISGKWKYKSSVDPKSGVKVSKPVVSSWGVSQRLSGNPSEPGEGDALSQAAIVHPGGAQDVAPPKQGKPRDPKWKPTPTDAN